MDVKDFVAVEEKKLKLKKKCLGRGVCLTHIGAPCCETWLKFEVAIAKKIKKKKNQGFLFTGFVPTGWAPCCERTRG